MHTPPHSGGPAAPGQRNYTQSKQAALRVTKLNSRDQPHLEQSNHTQGGQQHPRGQTTFSGNQQHPGGQNHTTWDRQHPVGQNTFRRTSDQRDKSSSEIPTTPRKGPRTNNQSGKSHSERPRGRGRAPGQCRGAALGARH
eukprot:165731-Chlamydomonas_euryale.AAC.2